MAKLEESRNVGLPVAHMGMEKNGIFINYYSTSICLNLIDF
jgi:hypothetical protein